MTDKEFKALVHNSKGYQKYKTGQSLEPGYKPDYVLRKGNDYIILESEKATSRKHFLGGMMKAAHFLQGERTGILIIVMTPRGNTTLASIIAQLKRYYIWLEDKTNLRQIYVIEHSRYHEPEKPVMALLGKRFMKLCTVV